MIHVPGKGDRVRVRTATGEERTVRVTGLGEGVAYVTTEDEHNLAVRDGREPIAFMGFPLEDVLEE